MIHSILFFSWRYLRGTSKKSSLSKLVKICFGAIVLGTFCLTIVAAIMQGFKHATYKTLQSIHADLIIEANATQELNSHAIGRVLTKEFPAVAAWAPRASSYIILEQQQHDLSQQTIVSFLALDPKKEAQTTQLEQTIRLPKQAGLENILIDNTIAIGSKLAHDLGVSIGDTLTLYYAPEQQHTSHNITFKKHKVKIAGIFSTGIADYDATVVWGSFELFNTLFPDEGVSSIGLRLAKNANENEVLKQLHLRLGLDVSAWYMQYPALLQALQLEHYAMYIILFFIVLLASLTMASTLMLHIEHKRTDIALLRAMGMTSPDVSKIFMFLGLCIAGTATICGMLSGWLASWIITAYRLIALPEAYYISYLPATVTPSYFLLLFGIACAISLVVVWFAARNSKTISISTILRGQTN